jgi:hypothetical protein
MKKILFYLKQHFQQDFSKSVYSVTLLFLTTCIFFNYQFDIESRIIDADKGKIIRALWYFFLYAAAYYGTSLIQFCLGKDKSAFYKKRFWLYSLFGLMILSFWHELIYLENNLLLQTGNLYIFLFKCFVNLNSLFTVLIPLLIFYFIFDRQQKNFYGLTFRHTDFRPYAWMLLIMLPLIGWASFQPDFLRQYPSYRSAFPVAGSGLPAGVLALIFELAYGWDFIATELVFRGFFVIGMSYILGRQAVLNMAVLYAFLHFGKPLGETIGSVFGGYILGVIALYTRNIWGGIAVHLGVAWLMELAAFMQTFLRH